MHTHLTRVHLKGFRNIQDTETTFREGLNIIIGPNGCGKSNFLYLLANMDSEETNKLRITGEFEINSIYGLFKINVLHKLGKNNTVFTDYIYDNTDKDKANNSLSEFLSWKLLLSYNIPSLIDCFSSGKTVLLEQSITPERIYYNSTINYSLLNNLLFCKTFPNYPKIQPSELNFEQQTINILKKYTPIEDIRVEFPQREDEIKEIHQGEIRISNLMYGFKTNNEWFKWNELSDGTRRIVWLVLNILTTNSNIILIEEPELGIHPLQLNKLMEFIKKESKNKQIIITTHSPEVLNVLEPDELDRIKLCKYDEVLQTTVMGNIPEDEQVRVAAYMKETGFLSDYWVYVDLEGTRQ